MVDRDETSRRKDRCVEGLRRAGVRLTHQRLEVCREIAESHGHPDAETLLTGVRGTVPTISLDTAYRTLWVLWDVGLVDSVGAPRLRVRFDANTDSHHHFVCRKCGDLYDFCSEKLNSPPVPEEVRQNGPVESIHVEVRGICNRCRTLSVRRQRTSR